MNKTAYLVGFVDTKSNPPVIRQTGIFSESSPTTASLDSFPVEIAKATDETYDSAVALLKGMLRHRNLEWARKILLLPPWERI